MRATGPSYKRRLHLTRKTTTTTLSLSTSVDISLAPVSQAGLDTSSRQEVSFSGSKGARFYVGVAKETGEPSGGIRCDF